MVKVKTECFPKLYDLGFHRGVQNDFLHYSKYGTIKVSCKTREVILASRIGPVNQIKIPDIIFKLAELNYLEVENGY